MGISGPNLNAKDDGIVIKDRRQLLVKVGSFMKSSWRKSTVKITDLIDDKDNKNRNDDDVDGNDNGNNFNNNRRRRRKHIFFVQFDDEVYVIPSPSSYSFDTCSTRNNNNNNNNTCNNEEQETRTQPMSETELNEEVEEEEDISSSWYQSDDYCKFKKDMILNSLNYINAKRASKVFDEEKYSIRGIEHMCSYASGDPNYRRRQTSEKKYLYKVIRDEQNKQQKQNCTSTNPYTKYDMDKFRSVSLTQTKNGRDRAISLGNEYAREQRQQQQKDEQQNQRNNNNNNTNNRGGGFTSSPSMKNLFFIRSTNSNNN
jgi:hypothetical protein